MTTLEFGDRVKKRRRELGYSQLELALKIGYKDKSSVAKIEAGNRDLPRSKIVEIATALSVTPQYLLGWDSEGAVRSTPDEHLLDSFHQLNSDGQELAIDYVDALAEKPKYQRTDEE